jgi:hypothetical protein
MRPANMPGGEQTPGQPDFNRSPIDRTTMDRMMRGKQTSAQRPYQETNPQVPDGGAPSVDPKLVQLAGGGQQLAQAQVPGGTATDALSNVPGRDGRLGGQGGLGAQQYPPYSGQHATKPDIDPNLPQTTGNAPEGRVAAIDSSIEDSSDPISGRGRIRPDLFRSPLEPYKKEMGPYDRPIDLLQGKKPSGVGCTVTDGMMTCTTPAGRTFTVPAPLGLSSFKPGDKDYHSYSYGIGPSGLPSDQLIRGVINAPTPGPSADLKPATPGGVLNEAQPDWQVPILKGLSSYNDATGQPINQNDSIYFSPVKTYLTKDQDGNQMVINVTEPGHPLFPGYVARYIVRTDSGFYIANEGEGSGSYQAPGAFGEGYINGIWKGQSRDIINRLK